MTADELVALFDLAPAGKDRFSGLSPNNGWRRVYGGQVLAQALIAAERTVAGRDPHSLHAYFLLGGDPGAPILYEVERLRDGRSFTTRRVVARQKEAAIFVMTVSFHEKESGFEHAFRAPAAPPPEACADPYEVAESLEGPARFRMKGMLDTTWPIEYRPTDLGRYAPGAHADTRQSFWTRIGERLPDDPALHRAALVYLSDMTLLDAALRPHGMTIFDHRLQLASLDHAVWFHRPARADDWLLYAQDSPNASGARGLVRGMLYARDGALAANVVQEGLLRRRNDLGGAD
jgi:acyl-CoA thioesterase II